MPAFSFTPSRHFVLTALAGTALSLSMIATSAQAQSVPSTADAVNVAPTTTAPTLGQSQPIRVQRNRQGVNAPEGAEDINLTLRQITLQGASHPEVFEDLADRYEGQEMSLADVYGLARAMTRTYRNAGYFLSQVIVPEQRIDNGNVTFRVIEGFVSSVNIQGILQSNAVYAHAKKIIDRQIPVGDGPLSNNDLEHTIFLLNDLPGVQARAVLAPAESGRTGGTEITFDLSHSNVDGILAADTFGNTQIGTTRLTGIAGFNSVFTGADRIEATGLMVPHDSELWYGDLAYSTFLTDEGDRLRVSMGATRTKPTLPDSQGGLLGIRGEVERYSIGYTHPITRGRRHNLVVSAGFDILNSKNLYAPGLESLETEDKTRMLNVGLNADWIDGFAGITQISASVSQGLSVFNATKAQDGNNSRGNGADGSFTTVNAEVLRLQGLGYGFSALAGVSGQWASDPLLAAHEFGLGGTSYGRGYDLSELTGDHGAAAKVELIHTGFTNENLSSSMTLNRLQTYWFYDVGSVWQEDPLASEDHRDSLASVGMGIRATLNDDTQGDVFVAKPLTADITSRGAHADNWRVRAQISTRF